MSLKTQMKAFSIQTRRRNTGNQRQPMAWMGSKSHGDNVSTHEIKRRLIKSDEIMRAPSDEMFVLARD
jgi:type IV secretory pathway TraG/TraD family ATPase VirD4